jgi:tripartite-type tricarboxylate transporter receptor subunit TctC
VKTVRLIVPYSEGGLDASSEQGSRVRDANVRESAAAPVFIAQASAPPTRYPIRAVRVIVPYSTGGGTDIMTRVITQRLSELWGQQIVVDNRAGGGTVIGTQLAVSAPADGYTLFVSAPSFVINPTTRPGLAYDVLRDFKPVTRFAFQPYVLVTHPKVPARDVKEFIALAAAHPDTLNFGSTGSGSGSHLAAELFKLMTHTRPQHISYKGMGPAVVDVLGGQTQFIFGSVLAVVPHVRSGKLNALGVTSERRSAALPALPTIAEAGVPGYSTVSWSGMHVPAGVPDAIINKLSADVLAVIARADVRERFLSDGAEPAGGSPAEFGRFIRDEIVKWRKVIQAAGIRID